MEISNRAYFIFRQLLIGGDKVGHIPQIMNTPNFKHH